MIYMLMIYADEADWTTKSEAEMAPIMNAHGELEQALRKAGKYKGCGGLAPTTAATVMRIGDGNSSRFFSGLSSGGGERDPEGP